MSKEVVETDPSGKTVAHDCIRLGPISNDLQSADSAFFPLLTTGIKSIQLALGTRVEQCVAIRYDDSLHWR